MRKLITLIIVITLSAVFVHLGSINGLHSNGYSVFFWCALIAFGINWLAFVPANLMQTEKFYDLVGSLTYLSMIAFAIYTVQSIGVELGDRASLVAAMVLIWAIRLGSFLFLRVLQDDGDHRFDQIKPDGFRFFLAWNLQAVWALVTASCALTIITSENRVALTALDYLAVLIWLTGFSIEAVADYQKRKFRKENGSGEFIRTGLWSLSRHPNYFGELLLWTGVALLAMPVFQSYQFLLAGSLLLIYALLTRISGIPGLQAKAELRWGHLPEYKEYLQNTNLLIPLPKVR